MKARGKGWAVMAGKIIVSGDMGLCMYSSPPEKLMAANGLGGLGPVCVGQRDLYAVSCRENIIRRFNRETLSPDGAFSGGPGITQLLLSRDGKRLYALCSEADSLLMLDTISGAPLVLARVGVNPCAIALDEQEENIAVAGGASGEVLLLSARSLNTVVRMDTCGIVFSVMIAAGCVFALSLTETMDTVLTSFLPGGIRRELFLEGLPGALCALRDCIAAATHLGLFFVGLEGGTILGRTGVPGRAGRLWVLPEGMMMTDMWSDTLFWRSCTHRCWECVMDGVKDAVYLKLFE